MICKDLGVDVKDDYSNFEELNKKELIGDELISKLKKLNGLRNVLVHKYNHIEDKLIEQEKDIIISDILKSIKRMEEILNDLKFE